MLTTWLFCGALFDIISISRSQVAQITLTVKVGQYVSMPCHSRITTHVDWFYKHSDTGADQQVCINGEVVGRFRGKVWVDISTSTYFNLIINSTRESDAGIYTCIEDAGLGPGAFVTRLTVNAADFVVQTTSTMSDASRVTDSKAEDSVMTSGTIILWSTSEANIITGRAYRPTSGGIDDERGPSNGAIVAIVIVILAVVILAAIIIAVRHVHRKRKPEQQPDDAAHIGLMNRGSNMQTPVPSTVQEKPSVIEQSPSDLLNTAMAEMKMRQMFMEATTSFFSSSSIPQGLQEAILAKTLKGLLMRLEHARISDGTPEINALITLAKVTKVWCRLIVNCDKEFRPSQISDIQTQNEVVGAACIEPLIFVVCNMSTKINVYRESSYCQIKTIKIPKMQQPVDVVSWIAIRSIAIADFEDKCIWLVHTNGRTHKWVPWSSGQSCRPCSLSVVRSMGQLAVATDNHRMLIFNQNRQQVRCFRFSSNADPQSAVMITTNKLAVYIPKRFQAAELKTTDDGVESVVFSRPFHLTFDDGGRCFFSDVKNNCVFILHEKEMRKCRLLLSPEKDNVKRPRKMCCMDSTGKLLVCDMSSVKVYELKHSSIWNLPLLRYLHSDMDMFQSGSSATLTTTPSSNVNSKSS